MAMQWDGALSLLSPVASPRRPSASRHPPSASLCQPSPRTAPRSLCFCQGFAVRATQWPGKHGARILLTAAASDWRSVFLEDDLSSAVSSEIQRVSVHGNAGSENPRLQCPTPQNPSSQTPGLVSEVLSEIEDGKGDEADEQGSQPLNGAGKTHEELLAGGGGEEQMFEGLNGERYGVAEAQVRGSQEQKAEILEPVEGLVDKEEQKLDSSVTERESLAQKAELLHQLEGLGDQKEQKLVVSVVESDPQSFSQTPQVLNQMEDLDNQKEQKLDSSVVESELQNLSQTPEMLNQMEGLDDHEEQKFDSTGGKIDLQTLPQKIDPSNVMEGLDDQERRTFGSSVGETERQSSSQMVKCKRVAALLKEKKTDEAIGLLSSISELDECVVLAYVELLQNFAKVKGVDKSKELHSVALRHGFLSNVVIASNFIRTYSKLGMVLEAQRVFNSMPTHDAASWNALISGYAKGGYHEEAVKLYHEMKVEGFQPESVTFVLMLNSCASKGDIELGREIHEDVKKHNLGLKLWISGALLNMYVKCRDLEEARIVFDDMPDKNVISWTSMISGYARSGNGREALNLYEQMRKTRWKPTDITYIFLLKACASLGELEQGSQIHADIIESGMHINSYLGTALIDMYSKCGCIEKAQIVFDKIPSPNVVAYATLVSGLYKNNKFKESVTLFMKLKEQGFKANGLTLAVVLHACGNARLLEEGIQIHNDVVEIGLASDVHVLAGLIDMYSRCGRLEVARECFDKVDQHTLVSWTSIIAAYARSGAGEEALKLFDQMKKEGLQPDGVTYVFVLLACAVSANLEMGRRMHDEIIKAGLESHVAVGSALVDMYAKCGSLEDSRMVFDRMPRKNNSTWTSLMAGYVKHENAEEAFKLYRKMKSSGLKPDSWVFACILNACVQLKSLEYGEEVHDDINRSEYRNDPSVGKVLSYMYHKCRRLEAEQEEEVLLQAA